MSSLLVCGSVSRGGDRGWGRKQVEGMCSINADTLKHGSNE